MVFLKFKIVKRITLLLLLCMPLITFSQSSGEKKIKGNKIIELKTQKIKEFTSIEVNNSFEVTLVSKSSPSVTVDADSNLHEHISINVIGDKLIISTDKVFTKYKRLLIEVGVMSDQLTDIIVKGKSELKVRNTLSSEKLNVEAYGGAKINLKYKTENASFFAKDKSEIELNGESDILSINVHDTAEIKADVICENFSASQNVKSKLTIEGRTANSILQISDTSYMNSAKFISGITVLSSTEKAESYVNVADKLTLQASGKTTTFILGEPLIDLKTFKDEATIRKTNKAPGALKKLLK